ncbi:ORFL108C [Human betaherpesvirus 5]|nr:ORFL108C [Human betaherpesvirus 5]QHX40425.1 ORFL108C [Human betaherpesvirus 5]
MCLTVPSLLLRNNNYATTWPVVCVVFCARTT